MTTTKQRGRPRTATVIRFVRKYRVKSNGCRQWTGASTNGYPVLYIDGRNRLVRPWAYRQFIGKIPEGYGVFMECKNQLCVNSEHMTLGYQILPGQWTVLPREQALILSDS